MRKFFESRYGYKRQHPHDDRPSQYSLSHTLKTQDSDRVALTFAIECEDMFLDTYTYIYYFLYINHTYRR